MYAFAGSNLMSPSSSKMPISFFPFEPMAYFATLLEHLCLTSLEHMYLRQICSSSARMVSPSRPSQTHLQLSVHSARQPSHLSPVGGFEELLLPRAKHVFRPLTLCARCPNSSGTRERARQSETMLHLEVFDFMTCAPLPRPFAQSSASC